jgi:cytosine/adenosine deaminase-related metal-dependent hydrolase
MTEGTPRFSLLSAARLLDGTQGAPLEDAALLLDGERIARLGRRDDVHAPDGTAVQRVDYGDATLLPGLVDAHTHLVAPGDGTLGDDIAKEDDDILLLQAARNARTLLHSGVTTLRENGAKGRGAFSLREGIRRKLAPGPRMVICGRPIADHRRPHGLLRVGGRRRGRVRAEVRKLLKEGADHVKIVARTDDGGLRLSLGLVRAGRVRPRDRHVGSGRPAVRRRHCRRHVRVCRIDRRGGRRRAIGPWPSSGRPGRARRPSPGDYCALNVVDVWQSGRRVERSGQ